MNQMGKLFREAAIQAGMRLGTVVGVWLVAQGVPADAAGQLDLGLAIIAGATYDYVAYRFFKKGKV